MPLAPDAGAVVEAIHARDGLSETLANTGYGPVNRGEPVILSTHPAYPNARAYVLKLHRDARPGQGRVIGRLENVTTGEQFLFSSADELLACLSRDAARHSRID